jgi:hypothetical protein
MFISLDISRRYDICHAPYVANPLFFSRNSCARSQRHSRPWRRTTCGAFRDAPAPWTMGYFGTSSYAQIGEMPYIQYHPFGAVFALYHCGPIMGKALDVTWLPIEGGRFMRMLAALYFSCLARPGRGSITNSADVMKMNRTKMSPARMSPERWREIKPLLESALEL